MIPILLASAPSLPERIDLGGAWRLTQAERKLDVPAVVPGVAQTDLMRAGVIPDPYRRLNEKAVQWVSDLPWSYARTFRVSPAFLARRRIVLRCEGLDTFATIRINGRELARTDNFFRTWEFDAKPLLRAGENTIRIDFETLASFLKRNEDRSKEFGKPVQEGGKPYIRKPAFQGGWDFAPKLLTTGIWRPIDLIGWDAARLTDVAVDQDHSKTGKVGLAIGLAADAVGPTRAHMAVFYGGREVAHAEADVAQGAGKAHLDVANPHLWWPNGMGPQSLYEVRVELRDAGGRVLDQGGRRIGLRTVAWIPKTKESPLGLVVNGRRFFAKGSNWVPFDSLLREDPAKERRLVQRAVGARMNLMRLWGGGYYVDDAFLDACDEKGLLTWFEFGYADSPYPSFDPRWLANARAEAEDNVRRVRHHPCLAVFSGNNEVIDREADKTSSWQMSRQEYTLLFRETLRDVVRSLAPDVPYTPGSPEIGDDHYWGVWHGSDPFADYRKHRGFMSEYGFQGFPSPRTVEGFTIPEDRTSVETPVMVAHGKNWRDGNALIVSTARRYFRKARDFDSTLRLGQIDQAYGILIGVEHWRRDWPNSTASLVWQYNDPWPGISWSMIDGAGRPKALYYALKRAYAPVALSGLADEKTGTVELWVVNDRPVAKAGHIDWTLTRADGTPLDKGATLVAIPAGTSRVRALTKDLRAVLDREGAANLLLWATLRTPGEPVSTTLLTFGAPKVLSLVDPGIKADVKIVGDGYRVTLTAARPALWTWVDLRDMDADFSDDFLHLQPGVPATINVAPAKKTSLAGVRRALTVRSLFDTYAPGTEPVPTIAPDAEGKVLANVDDAEIQSGGPSLEMGSPSDLGGWRSLDGGVAWTVRDLKAGTYAVTALVAAPASDSGGKFEVSVDDGRVSATVPTTKSWTDYVTLDLGRVTVAKDGTASIVVRGLSKPHDNLMNLRSVTLAPVKG